LPNTSDELLKGQSGEDLQSPSLAELSDLNRELTQGEIKAVFEHVPLIVLADDVEPIRRMALGVVRMVSQNRSRVVDLRGNMAQCFDAAKEYNGAKLPMILCNDGNQAREAVQIICERGIPSGIVALDESMGGPRGMSIFKEFNEKIPPKIVKILQSSNPPDDTKACLEAGIVDASVDKFGIEAIPTVARAYLRRIFGEPSK